MPHVAASRSHSVNGCRDKLQFAVAFNIALAARLWRAHFADRMKELGQTDARWSALYAIADEPGGVIQTVLAERLGIKGPSLVPMLDALEQQGLVSRHRVFGDRRANNIIIESKGRDMLIVLDSFVLKMRTEAFEGVSDMELETTLSVLRSVGDRLGASAVIPPDAQIEKFIRRSA